MTSPLTSGAWVELEEVGSTQDYAAKCVRGAIAASPGIVIARHQTAGKGRFDRVWVSPKDEALTMTLVFRDYAGHQRPWLIGMAVAAAVAGTVHARLRWPNDIMIEGKKLGGILTNVVVDSKGRRIPLVGVGLNLNNASFPAELEGKATSLTMVREATYDPKGIAEQIIGRIETMPEPDSWQELSGVWSLFDDTPGKRFLTPEGLDAVAIGIGPEGELICAVNGETQSVMAADALVPS